MTVMSRGSSVPDRDDPRSITTQIPAIDDSASPPLGQSSGRGKRPKPARAAFAFFVSALKCS